LIPCCTDKTCSISLLGMCSVAMVQSVPLLRLRARGMPPVRCALSNASTKALEKWITASGKKRTDYLFPGRGVERRHPMGPQQLSRLLKIWVVEVGLDPSDYSLESLRRTKALHILKGTGDLQTVRALNCSKFASFQRNENTRRTQISVSFGTARKGSQPPARCVSFHIRERCTVTNSELKYQLHASTWRERMIVKAA
jgi:Phage integrase family